MASRCCRSPGRTVGSRWRSRTDPYRGYRHDFRDRVEGAIPHRGRDLRLCRWSQWPGDGHLRLPNAKARPAWISSATSLTGGAKKFQIFLASLRHGPSAIEELLASHEKKEGL